MTIIEISKRFTDLKRLEAVANQMEYLERHGVYTFNITLLNNVHTHYGAKLAELRAAAHEFISTCPSSTVIHCATLRQELNGLNSFDPYSVAPLFDNSEHDNLIWLLSCYQRINGVDEYAYTFNRSEWVVTLPEMIHVIRMGHIDTYTQTTVTFTKE